MAKRTRLTDAEQQQLLDNFYESSDVEDEPNEFEEADVFMEENGEDVLAEELFENVDCVRGENVDDVAAEEEMSVVRKQRFNDLAEILDEGNFDDLPPQDKKEFIYHKINRWRRITKSYNGQLSKITIPLPDLRMNQPHQAHLGYRYWYEIRWKWNVLQMPTKGVLL